MREGDPVLDALPFGVCRAPQLEILDPVVRAEAIDVVHDLVGTQGALKMPCHDESMLERRLLAVREPSVLERY